MVVVEVGGLKISYRFMVLGGGFVFDVFVKIL